MTQFLDNSRRDFLKKSLFAAGSFSVGSALPPFAGSAFAAGEKTETTGCKLGFIALTDCAPLVIAKEKGLFAKHGMPDVQVIEQASWGTTRDNLELGSGGGGIDGAHILTPMPYAMTLGLNTKGNRPVPMYVMARLNLNSQAISVADKYRDLKIGVDAKPLKAQIDLLKRKGAPVLKVAMTFPTGTHNYWIRYWLAAAGIDPDKDVSTIVVPPPQMVANMRVGNMDAFCVGEPWNQQLINQRIGYTACTTQDIWKDHPEKCLGMRKDWVDANPKSARALVRAVMEAQIWCDSPANKAELAQILSGRNWIGAAVGDLLPRLKGDVDYGDGRKHGGDPMVFWAKNASYPWKSHDKWFLAESRRWGFLPNGVDYDKVVNQVNRSDIWRECAGMIGQAAPTTDSQGEEKFFDGMVFNPGDPEAYLSKLAIKNLSGAKKA